MSPAVVQAMRIRPPRTVTAKLNVYIGVTACALLLGTVWVSYYSASGIVERQMNAEATRQVHSLAEKMDDTVSRIADLPNSIAWHQQNIGDEPTRGMVSYLATLLNQTELEEAQSVYIAYEKRDWKDKESISNT